MNQGCWDGKQIVPAEWVKESTTPYSDTMGDFQPLGLGYYGYMWWVGANKRFLPNTSLPDGSFAALGLGPQVILVIPAQGLVLVHQTATDSVCPFSSNDCTFTLIPNRKVFTLLEMIVQAKK
jgi:CubicO group peptidase (beta-lactamase class C family)